MKTLNTLKAQYRKGDTLKAKYIREMYNIHRRLFEYPTLMKSTDIAKIQLSDEGVIMSTRRANTRFLCPEKDERVSPIEILNFDVYEQHEFNVLMQLVQPHNVIFDVGANIGWYSINIAQQFPKAQIYAFEPIKNTYEYLRKNIDLNGLTNIKAFNFGLSDKSKKLAFYYYPEGSGNASAKNLSKSRHVIRLPCRVKKMDDFVRLERCRVDVIKCDVEGAELLVFRGGIETIKRDKPVIFSEILRKWSKQFNYNPNEIITLITSLSYLCYSIRSGKLRRFVKMDKHTQETNFIFLHRQKHATIISSLSRRSI